jgi:hypothetical protein
MKKIIRLNENDIENLVRKIITEGSFKEDTLIEKTYDLLELLGYDYVEDFYIQSLEEAAEILEVETYQHGSILDGEIQNLLTEIYSIIGFPGEDEDEYNEEDYMQEFKKPSMFQRLKKQGKDLMNIESKSDRQLLDNIHRMIDAGRVDNIRQHDNGVTAWVNNKALIVDKETPEIIYAGQELDVVDVEMEAIELSAKLVELMGD